MKIKRHKKAHKHMSFYINHFNFRQPYQILVDGTFCFAALNNKVNIADNIPRYLQGEIKLLTTQCAIIEMETLSSKLGGALLILKQYVVHKCGHEGKPIPGSKCLLSMLGKTNENHYMIATQDRSLQDQVRNVVGVPLLYLHIKTPVLEEPSTVTLQSAKNKVTGIGVVEQETIEAMKRKSGLVPDNEKRKKKRRRPKAPNPLSCKKKKKPQTNGHIAKNLVEGTAEKEKKKRKKIRIPKHVKEAIKDNL